MQKLNKNITVIDNNTYKTEADNADISHVDPNADMMTEISQIRPPKKKRNYFNVLQKMKSNNKKFYGRRCFGTLTKDRMGQYWLKSNQDINGHISTHHSCYCTVNTFKKGGSLITNKKTGSQYYWYHHSEDLIEGLCGLYVDLDAKQIGLTYGREIVPYYKFILKLSGLPTPSFVIDTGHGLHILWLFNSEVVVHSPIIKIIWQKVEDYFVDHMSKASIKLVKANRNNYDFYTYLTRSGHYDLVDHRVANTARYLRVPGSYNCKDHNHKILVRTIADNHVSYSLTGKHSGLYYDLIGKFSKPWINYHDQDSNSSDKKNKPNHKKNIKKNEKVSSKSNPRPNSQVVISAYKIRKLGKNYFLLMDRISDYKELIYLRNKYQNSGSRNEILFWYVVAKTQLLFSKEQVLAGARKMNQKFNVPLPDDEVVGIARCGSHTTYSPLQKYQRSCNEWIMGEKHLNITSGEQRHMITLTDNKERGRRIRRAKLKSHKRVDRWRKLHGYAGRVTKAMYKRAELRGLATYMALICHMSKSEIARKLSKSRRTIIRWMKPINSLLHTNNAYITATARV